MSPKIYLWRRMICSNTKYGKILALRPDSFCLPWSQVISCWWWITKHILLRAAKPLMVFCYQNCSDLLWEKIVLLIKKNFWNSRLKAENLQIFEITRTIYSNSDRSEQFLVTTCFFNLFLEVCISYDIN